MIDPALEPKEANQAAYLLVRSWIARDGATKCGTASEHEDGTAYFKCLYADGEGNHCAIGGPMRDVLTTEIINGNPCASTALTQSDVYGDAFEKFWGQADPDLLDDLQGAHDHTDAGPAWQLLALHKLDDTAKSYGLSVAQRP